MTIAGTDKEIKGVINEHSVYGCEAIMNAIARACKDHPYLQPDDLKRLLEHAIKRAESEVKANDN